MKLIIIRHGDPDYSIDSLTEKGWREAELLSERVKTWDVAQFYVSPLGRAQDTANVSLKKIGKDAIILPWLREFYIPITDPETGKERHPWDFMPNYFTLQEQFYDVNHWMDSQIMKTGKVAEEYRYITTELDKLLFFYGYQRFGKYYKVMRGNEETIVMFCHFGLAMVLLSHLLGIPAPILWQGMFIAPTGVTLLCTEERVKKEAYFRCKMLSDVSHLYIGNEKPSDSGFFQETNYL